MILNKKSFHQFIFYTLVILSLSGCGVKQTLQGVLRNQTPYEQYASSLKTAKLHNTALGTDWLEAGEKALQDSITVSLPFKETGYFAADKPRAVAYRFDGRRGEQVVVKVEIKGREPLQIFMDLFELQATALTLRHIAHADTLSSGLRYTIAEDGKHLLRLQPELLRSGQFTLSIYTEPTLAFPVAGKSSRHISSAWGAPRDAGTRAHEGIDIFAPRGTPALAAAAGIVSGVGTNGLGEKVVWLTDTENRQRLYYAHLDRQLVTEGQRVEVGDTIGLIGNTGNARGTGPHLHFGIYRLGLGAVNPYPYLHQSNVKAPSISVNAANIGNLVRITAKKVNIRLQPSGKGEIYTSLPQHTPLFVTGATSDWYRVQLPDGAEAYVSAGLTGPVAKPVHYTKLTSEKPLLEAAHPQAAAKESIKEGSVVAVLGVYEQYEFVSNGSGETGWLMK